jgi:hypothetical protein
MIWELMRLGGDFEEVVILNFIRMADDFISSAILCLFTFPSKLILFKLFLKFPGEEIADGIAILLSVFSGFYFKKIVQILFRLSRKLLTFSFDVALSLPSSKNDGFVTFFSSYRSSVFRNLSLPMD